MDLVTINDSQIGIVNLPVRLTSISEDDQYQLDCEAEPFLYGVNSPLPVTVTPPAPFVPVTQTVPADVNAPVFVEPISRLSGTQNQQLWIVVSDSDLAYAGCQVFLSTDGGASYNNVGTITGNGITGVTASWPPRPIRTRRTTCWWI